MTYPLTVLAATEILEEVMTYQQDVTKCAVCFQHLGDDTYLICDFPVADGAVREVKKVHQGHTACKSCVEARDYVGEKGACVACLNDVTKQGARRSAVKLAGVAKIPAVKNALADSMIKGFRMAEKQMEDARDRQDFERRQEGVERRTAAVEEKRKKREREEEEAAARLEHAEQEAKEQIARLKAQAEQEAKEAKAQAEQEAARLKAQAELEAKEQAARLKTEKKEAKKKEAARLKALEEEQTARLQAQEEEQAARLQAQEEEQAARLRAQEQETKELQEQLREQLTAPQTAPGADSPKKRKVQVLPDAVREERRVKAKCKRNETKAKVQAYDDMKKGFDHMQKKLSCTYLCAMEFIEGIDESLVETFQAKLEKEIETMEKDEEENEIMEREAEEEAEQEAEQEAEEEGILVN